MRYNTLTLCLIGAVVLLSILVLYLYQQRDQKNEQLDMTVELEPKGHAPVPAKIEPAPAGPSSSPVLVLFHATWCPHCRDVLPLWPQVKAGVAGKLDVIDVESKNPIMANHKIQGFPTIRFFPQGMDSVETYVDHTGPRTVDGVMQFLASLSKPQ